MSAYGPLHDQLALLLKMAQMHGLTGAVAVVREAMDRIEVEAEIRKPIKGQEELPL